MTVNSSFKLRLSLVSASRAIICGRDSCVMKRVSMSCIDTPSRSATDFLRISSFLILFQSTHPYGVRHLEGLQNFSSHSFQSTHPYGVRQSCHRREFNAHMFQSTHPYGVRPRVTTVVFMRTFVSIHAPVRGATQGSPVSVGRGTVSIHAPVRGATTHMS